MLNHITIMGRLTRAPEMRRVGDGAAVAAFTLACDRDYKDKSTGERATDFLDCVAWRNTAEFVSQYLDKGRMVVVEGRLEIQDWTDKEGNKRRSAKIRVSNVYFADAKRGDAGQSGAPEAPSAPMQPNSGISDGAVPPTEDDFAEFGNFDGVADSLPF